MYDSKTREQLLGRRYTVSDPSMIRQVAHQVADQIVYQLSSGASRGVAQTQIAFSSLKGHSKEIYVMGYDGTNVRTITANGGINKFPEWAIDNSKLVFITKLLRRSAWELWIQDLAGGRTVIPTRPLMFLTHLLPGWSSGRLFVPRPRPGRLRYLCVRTRRQRTTAAHPPSVDRYIAILESHRTADRLRFRQKRYTSSLDDGC